mmetsp:Transcript_54388/g.172778  ORF Transcript_54388/g.172778 Transcript_54388/m.172778 type:complete len:353 (-) Transcript_54388:91-1149(-)
MVKLLLALHFERRRPLRIVGGAPQVGLKGLERPLADQQILDLQRELDLLLRIQQLVLPYVLEVDAHRIRRRRQPARGRTASPGLGGLSRLRHVARHRARGNSPACPPRPRRTLGAHGGGAAGRAPGCSGGPGLPSPRRGPRGGGLPGRLLRTCLLQQLEVVLREVEVALQRHLHGLGRLGRLLGELLHLARLPPRVLPGRRRRRGVLRVHHLDIKTVEVLHPTHVLETHGDGIHGDRAPSRARGSRIAPRAGPRGAGRRLYPQPPSISPTTRDHQHPAAKRIGREEAATRRPHRQRAHRPAHGAPAAAARARTRAGGAPRHSPHGPQAARLAAIPRRGDPHPRHCNDRRRHS